MNYLSKVFNVRSSEIAQFRYLCFDVLEENGRLILDQSDCQSDQND